jgi:hypothetical protein
MLKLVTADKKQAMGDADSILGRRRRELSRVEGLTKAIFESRLTTYDTTAWDGCLHSVDTGPVYVFCTCMVGVIWFRNPRRGRSLLTHVFILIRGCAGTTSQHINATSLQPHFKSLLQLLNECLIRYDIVVLTNQSTGDLCT